MNHYKGTILYCHNDYRDKNGGEYNVFIQDIELLKKSGYNVIIFQKNNDVFFDTTFSKKIKEIIKSFFNLDTIREINNLADIQKIKFAIVQNTYLSISPSVYYALKKRNIPIVQMVYNYSFLCPNAHFYTHGKICERCLSGNYFNAMFYKCRNNNYLISAWYAALLFINKKIVKADKIITKFITPDNFLRNKLIEGGIDPSKIEIMRNPFDKKEYNISEKDEGYFLFVGRFIKQKGIYTLLNAAQKLTNISFKLIGSGIEEESIKLLYHSANVEFLGAKYGIEMVKVLEKARAIIVPSEWYDNYPVVISYAFALGKPVIASNINGIPEIVIDKKNGLLFEPGNEDDLVEKILILYKDKPLANLLGKKGKEFLESELSFENRMKKYGELILHNQKQLKEHWENIYSAEDPYGYSRWFSDRKRRESSLNLILTRGLHFYCSLELGCGEGYITNEMINFCEKIIAVDISIMAMTRAKLKLNEKKDKILFINADIYELEFKPNTFDFINALESLDYTDEPQSEINKWINWLCPGGYLIFSGPNLKKYFSYIEMTNLFNRPELNIIEILPVTSKSPLQYLINRKILPESELLWSINMFFAFHFPKIFSKHVSILVQKKML